MPNETDTIIVSRSVEEDKGTSGVVQEDGLVWRRRHENRHPGRLP